MQAVILAGGKGTRLASLLNGKPKCLVDVDGVPLLERQIDLLKSHGVDSVILLVNHAAEHVAAFLAEHRNFGIDILLIDDGQPRGTGGAVLECLDRLSSRFVVLYGDTLLNVDLGRFLTAHEKSVADVTVFVHPNDHPADSDLVELDEDGWVLRFHNYPHQHNRFYPNLVNAALYAIERDALTPWRRFGSPSDFAKDLFPAMLQAGVPIKGYNSFEYIKDVGTPARLAAAVKHLRDGKVARSSLTSLQKAVFLDRDGTLNVHKGQLCRAEDLELLPGVAQAVKLLNNAEFRAVLVTNQPVVARGEASIAEVRRIHARLETELGLDGAYLDAIYLCPHHPHKGFHGEIPELKIDCDCRKPSIGMITQAIRDLNIDINRSWLVGDTTVDMETARRVGAKSVLVRTGEAGGDGKYPASPNFTAESLLEAVEHIIFCESAL
jgi:histidinol-phosphate phosphatase family protein